MKNDSASPVVSPELERIARELEATLESLEGMSWGDSIYGCKREARRQIIQITLSALALQVEKEKEKESLGSETPLPLGQLTEETRGHPLGTKWTTHHMCVDITSVLRWPDKTLVKLFNGGELWVTGGYVRDYLKLQLAKGRRVLPMGDPCEGFSYETGCPGHPHENAPLLQSTSNDSPKARHNPKSAAMALPSPEPVGSPESA